MAVLLAVIAMLVAAASAQTVDHVLLLSVDGMHQSDLAIWTMNNPNSNLSRLSKAGITYTNAHTTSPSDSFPGMLALVTGGTPLSTGIFYDDSYDYSLSPPIRDLAPGVKPCSTNGTVVLFDETVDLNDTMLNGGGGLDPNALPRDPSKPGCPPVYPHQHVNVNTVFNVIKAAGGYTAWCDKHLAYDLLNGAPGGGIDDLCMYEQASNPDNTAIIGAAVNYDSIRVQVLLNQIKGINSTNATGKPIPKLFGMNFQALSVAQKINTGGYLYNGAAFGSAEQIAMQTVDAAVGQLTAALTAAGINGTTAIIISAKHGQTPIDHSTLRLTYPLPGQSSLGGPMSSFIIKTLGRGNNTLLHAIEDDVGLYWLERPSDGATVAAAFEQLNSTAQAALGVQRVIYGDELMLAYGDDTNVNPSIIGVTIPGVVYVSKPSKIAEHGGFSDDDTHVGLLVMIPGSGPKGLVSAAAVSTTQVAPTILQLLGLQPSALQAVTIEGTRVLPSIFGLASAPAPAPAMSG